MGRARDSAADHATRGRNLKLRKDLISEGAQGRMRKQRAETGIPGADFVLGIGKPRSRPIQRWLNRSEDENDKDHRTGREVDATLDFRSGRHDKRQ